jgi:glucose-1-phosphate adenylyltransferase
MKSDPLFLRSGGELTRATYAVVLAGGRGKRLHELTDWRSKPAVPFAGKFRIVDFALSNCVNSGVRRIGVATQYKAQSLIGHLQRGWSFMQGRFNEYVDILPAQQQVQEAWYRGTADAVFQNLDIIRSTGCDYVLVLSGDQVYKMDYGKLLADHVASSADMTVGCIEVPLAEASGFGVIGRGAERRIVSFTEKPKNPTPIPDRATHALASMGIYAFNSKFLYEQLTRDADDSASSHDFGKDLIPYAVPRYKVMAHRFASSCVGMQNGIAYWRDVGTLDAYWEANIELAKVTPELNLYDKSWPIWTYQDQLPPAKFVFDDEGRRGMTVDSLVSAGCVISGATIRRSLIFSNVHVHSFANVEDSVILPDVDIGRSAVLKHVIVDRGCNIPPGLVVGENHDDDRRRYRVTEKGITLITPDMLGQPVHRLR